MDEHSINEPSLIETAKRNPILIVAMAFLFGFIALIAARLLFDDWVAEVSILIEDPTSSQIFETALVTQPERYFASQVAIIESSDFAESVREMVGGADEMSTKEILDARDVSSRADANVIAVSFSAADPDVATRYANAYGEAYRNYREDVTINTFESAIAGLNGSIADVDEELAGIDAQLSSLSTVEQGSDLEQSLQDTITNFLSSAPNNQSTAELEAVLNRLQTLQILRSLESQNPTQVALMDTRRESLERKSQLVLRRDQLQVDAALATTGIVAISEAEEPARGLSTVRVVAVGVIFGLLVGLALAYYNALRNQRFSHWAEPESVLNVPMLSDVPRLSNQTSHGMMPVIDDPASPPAEAFRFVANAIGARLTQLEVRDGSPKKALVVTSALMGDGKTSVVVNTGFALATRGKSVLLIDADFGDPSLSEMLIGETESMNGITNVVAGDATLSEAAFPVDLGNGLKIDVLTRGTTKTVGGDFFNSSAARKFFNLVKTKYDIILIDTPPFLQVSYSTSVAALADGVVIVIPHEGKVSTQRDLMDRLGLINTAIVGYVYSKAPKRPELHERRGSMRDPLGSGQLANR